MQVLDGLGMGPRGPPIPPPAGFAVVPFPVKRRAPPVSEFGGRYIFVASSPDDPYVQHLYPCDTGKSAVVDYLMLVYDKV